MWTCHVWLRTHKLRSKADGAGSASTAPVLAPPKSAPMAKVGVACSATLNETAKDRDGKPGGRQSASASAVGCSPRASAFARRLSLDDGAA